MPPPSPTSHHAGDTPELVRAFVRTYDGGSGRDEWERVRTYREVREYVAEHPEEGSSAVASALDLSRSAIRAWVDGDARPDAVRGLEVASGRRWLQQDWATRQAAGLNVLVAWVFSGGSITTSDYTPHFAVDHRLSERVLGEAVDRVGVDIRVVHDEDDRRATEHVPAADASVLGRVLHAWGGPTGAKNDDVALDLPSYLVSAPEWVRRDFARTYLLNRGHVRGDRERLPVQLGEARTGDYRDQVVALLRSLVADPDSVVPSGDHLVYVYPESSDDLFQPPAFGPP